MMNDWARSARAPWTWPLNRALIGMDTRPLLFFLAALVAAVAVPAQDDPAKPIQSPEVMVSAAPLAPDAAGVTSLDLQPGVQPAVSAWELLSRSVANFHVADSGAGGYGGLFAIRGLANTPYFSDPAVTVYLDAIPLAGSFTYPTGLFGLDSVEVFRGPQGTRFGRATDGGVVVFSPDAAGYTAGGEVLSGYGSYGARQFAVAARTAPKGIADAEVNADYEARSGYITNQRLGIRVDDEETETMFARFRLLPATGAPLTFEVFDSRSRDGAQPLVPLGGALFDVSRAKEGVTDLDSWAAALKGSFALPSSGSLTAVTSFSDWRMNPYQSLLVLPPALENRVLQDQKSWNEEIRLQSDPLAAFRVEAGAWLSKGTTDNNVNRSIPGLYPVEASGFVQRSQSAALFCQAVYAPSRAWQIIAGLRAEDDEKGFFRSEQVPISGLDYTGSDRCEAFLPKLAAKWATGADSHVEASVSLGLRPGGFSSYTDNPALIPFAAERSTAYSVGWVTSSAQRSASLVVRAFYDDIGNLQIERSFSPTDYLVATAPRAHSVGGEVAARWRPAADWTLGLSAGWSEVRLDTFFAPLSGANESGDEAPNAPHYNAELEAGYRPGRGWFVTGQLAATGRTQYDERGAARYTQDAYALIGLQAGYATARWTATVYGENLADQQYYELIVPGVNSGDPGAPRTVGAKVEMKF